MKSLEVVVLGGGAAGFFAAIACAEKNATAHVRLLEVSDRVLSKVLISGGGRCNVTHACFDPVRLVTYYPRGGRELRGPFSRFDTQDTVDWFGARGVTLKTEADGRMFPTTDRSQTIADCLLEHAQRAGVEVLLKSDVASINTAIDGSFVLTRSTGALWEADRVILATGSNRQAWKWASAFGHHVEDPVPSLFTFTINDPRLEGLAGVAVPSAVVRLEGTPLSQTGALLITHWGLSGPAVLKLSAWGARVLHDQNYRMTLRVQWMGDVSTNMLFERLKKLRADHPKKNVHNEGLPGMPQRLWSRLAETVGIRLTTRWTEVSNDRLAALTSEVGDAAYSIVGKGVFKEEFVTCGGVRLDEVNLKTMESKRCKGLYFAGEVLDIDAVTGGFNFQSAWTTGWLAGTAAASEAVR